MSWVRLPYALVVLMTSGLILTSAAVAGPRSSANYTIAVESISSGGGRITSASYTNDGSVGEVAGVSTVAAPAETVKAGYVGQLYEVNGLQLAATPATVNEGGTRQIAAAIALDDGTTLAGALSGLDWSVLSGPVASISSSGVALAENVYKDTAATVQGTWQGASGTLNLTVLNVGNDDFGLYANDGIPDDWQVGYFGVNNPLGVASADPSGAGQTNLFKYTAGLDPTDAAALFTSRGAAVPGQLYQYQFSFGPVLAGRTYTVQYSSSLRPGSWQALTNYSQQDNGGTRTVTDNAARGHQRFYRVLISIP